MVNLQPEQGARVTVKLVGGPVGNVAEQVLTASALDAYNTFDAPDHVRPAPFTAFEMKNGVLTLDLPAKSVVVLSLLSERSQMFSARGFMRTVIVARKSRDPSDPRPYPW